MTIEEFCNKYGACCEGREWALAHCTDMHEVWRSAKPEWLIWVATRPGVLTDPELRLFACWCARQVWHLLTDERSRTVVEVAERFARGEATKEELKDAWYAAGDIACTAAGSAARYAGRYWAWYAAEGAAWGTYRCVSHAAQSQYLRENTKPCFEVGGEE